MVATVEGKVIIVTGAGGGIGKEIALLAAREGAKVVVNDLGSTISGDGEDSSRAEKVAEEITTFGGEAIPDHHSIADEEQAGEIVSAGVDRFGRIDGVVNCAGMLRDRIFHKMSAADWQAVIDVHLSGYFYVSRHAAEHFRNQGSGSFVHFTSTSGLIGSIGQANYSAAKMGVVGLSRSIALDMARFGVRSNCIAPFAWGRMIETIPTGDEVDIHVERMRNMPAAKIAPFAVGLLGDAAKDVNGQVFAVRANEIFLMSQPRPIASVANLDGWSVETVGTHALPALKRAFYGSEVSDEIFDWDPV